MEGGNKNEKKRRGWAGFSGRGVLPLPDLRRTFFFSFLLFPFLLFNSWLQVCFGG